MIGRTTWLSQVLVDAHLPHDLTALYIAHALHYSTQIKERPANICPPQLDRLPSFIGFHRKVSPMFELPRLHHYPARHPFHALATLGALGSFRSHLHPSGAVVPS